MKINETIKHLQSQIKHRSLVIADMEELRVIWKTSAKMCVEDNDERAFEAWRLYRKYKDSIRTLAKQQKIEKNLYKYLLDVRKAVGIFTDEENHG